ncbi:MAG: hypothetical protein AVDCRST_MAG74-683, partial [uncultured Pyrinomonadaceae bacterium]
WRLTIRKSAIVSCGFRISQFLCVNTDVASVFSRLRARRFS